MEELEKLRADLQESTVATLALNQTIQSEKRRKRFSRVAITLLVILLALEGVGDYFSWKQSRDNGDSLNILEDATTPGGTIYERGVKGTADAICTLITEERGLHGVDTKKYPCDKPLPIKTETAPTNVYRGEDGFCFGTTEEDAKRRGLTPDPTCVEG